METRRFIDKVVLVTGGNAGIGKATAMAFAREGAKVVITARRDDIGRKVAEEMNAYAGEGIFIRTDITRLDDIDNLFNMIVKTYGRLDCAFNNAGINPVIRHRIHKTSEEEWNSLINTNLKSVWFCMKRELELMVKQRRGSIVNNASILGLIGEASATIYVTSKHGVVGLTKSAAIEYAERNIRINAVCPGFIDTDMTGEKYIDQETKKYIVLRIPMGRLGKTEEIAGAVLWLCSDEASFMTGQTMVIDGGQSVT